MALILISKIRHHLSIGSTELPVHKDNDEWWGKIWYLYDDNIVILDKIVKNTIDNITIEFTVEETITDEQFFEDRDEDNEDDEDDEYSEPGDDEYIRYSTNYKVRVTLKDDGTYKCGVNRSVLQICELDTN